MALRRSNPLWQALALLLGVAVFLFLLYDLYSAWMYHMIFDGGRFGGLSGRSGWISPDAHPTAFSWRLGEDCAALVLLVEGTAFAARTGQIRFLRRKSGPR